MDKLALLAERDLLGGPLCIRTLHRDDLDCHVRDYLLVGTTSAHCRSVGNSSHVRTGRHSFGCMWRALFKWSAKSGNCELRITFSQACNVVVLCLSTPAFFTSEKAREAPAAKTAVALALVAQEHRCTPDCHEVGEEVSAFQCHAWSKTRWRRTAL